jgi:uncharacterized protein with HEPN domain
MDEAQLLIELTDGYDLQRFLGSVIADSVTSCMTLIHIGESVKLLSDELKQENEDIPWRYIFGLRDIAAHGYETLYMDTNLEKWYRRRS